MRLLCSLWLAAACAPAGEPRACNGAADLCDRPLDEVRFAGTHNAMSNVEDGFLIPNQPRSVRHQLDDGVRAMLIDTYLVDGQVVLCHGDCGNGVRLMSAFLDDVAAFLEDHPDEVLIWVVQDAVGPAAMTSLFEEEGWTERLYVHRGGEWPSLAELLDAGTPVLFTAEGDATASDPAWFHRFYDLGSDTPYQHLDVQDFSCDVLRGSASNDLFLLNHWLSRPFSTPALAVQANAREVLLTRAMACEAERGPANIVAVDHYTQGALFEVVRALNGLLR